MINGEKLGKKISELCKQQGIKQKELAEKVGITEVSISRYVRGERIPRRKILIQIANYLHTTPEYLMDFEDTENQNPAFYRAVRLVATNRKNWTQEQKAELINTLLLDE